MLNLWLLIIVIGLVTYALRLSLVLSLGRVDVPPLVIRALRYVPPAVLSAIILPELFHPGDVMLLSFIGARLIAGLIAIVVAWRTRNVLLTISVGMAALWLVQALAR